MKDFQFLILGHGLAGACLASNLSMNNETFRVLHSEDKDCASEKAAGLMNPVTGRRMALTWNHEILFPLARNFYSKVWMHIHKEEGSFLIKRTIRKALHSIEEVNFLSAKSAWNGYSELIEIEENTNPQMEIFNKLQSWAITNDGARMNVPDFLFACRKDLESAGKIVKSNFEMEDLRKIENGWEWKGSTFENVVSCLGIDCPWVGPDLWPVKGQMYEFSGMPDWGQDILKTDKFMIPLENGHVLAGSTYERDVRNHILDEAGLEEVTSDLLPHIKQNLKLEKAWAGVRPTTPDRLPIIKKIEDNLYCINGMGTKGVSLAPWATQEIIRIIKEEQEAKH